MAVSHVLLTPERSVEHDRDRAVSGPPSSQASGLRIGAVSHLVGVPVSTLRSWQLRYDIPLGTQKFGEHRVYGPNQLRATRLMCGQVNRGQPASAAAVQVTELLAQNGPGSEYVRSFLQASDEGDVTAMRSHLDQALLTLGLGTCLDEVLFPALQQVGSSSMTGDGAVHEELLASRLTRSWLRELGARYPLHSRTDPIMLTSGPGESHTVGLEAFEILLRSRNLNCRLLPALTATQLVEAVKASRSRTVVLVSHLATNRRRAIESLLAVHQLGVDVFFAGSSFSMIKIQRAVPGQYLGLHLQTAMEMVAAPRRG